MKVAYIGKMDFYDGLTTGKIYEVIEETETKYIVSNDLGGTSTISKEKFEIMSIIELKPCPFCGGKAKLSVSDSEGNFRNSDYANDPYSGLMYRINHSYEENEGCPIANYEIDGGSVGVYLYENQEEAIEAWNKRHDS